MAEEKITVEEVKADQEKKARKKAERAAKNKALEVLKELVDKQQDPKYKVALSTVKPSLYGISSPGSTGSAAYQKFVEFVQEKKTINEEEVFKAFKIGRKDCASFIRNHLKKVAPEDRLWITFDNKTGIYTFVAKGKNPPAGWAGYVPADENIDLNK